MWDDDSSLTTEGKTSQKLRWYVCTDWMNPIPERAMTALMDANGIVLRWPRRSAERLAVLDHLARKFEAGRVYSEKEVNQRLNEFHSFGDWAMLRRELFAGGWLDRNPRTGQYWLKRAERMG